MAADFQDETDAANSAKVWAWKSQNITSDTFLFISQNKSQGQLDLRRKEMVSTFWWLKWHAYTRREGIGGGQLWSLSSILPLLGDIRSCAWVLPKL